MQVLGATFCLRETQTAFSFLHFHILDVCALYYKNMSTVALIPTPFSVVIFRPITKSF